MFSEEHIKYIKKEKNFKTLVAISQISIIITFIIIWQLLANANIINTFITSSPNEIIKTVINLFKTNNLFQHIWITVYEILISFVVGTLSGIVIASLLWSNNFIAKVLDPYLTVLNSLPKIALGPILIIWVGANINSIIVMALLISVVTTTIYIYQSFMNTSKLKLILMKSLGATKLQCFTKLVLPNSFKNIISTLKINLSLSSIGVIMGEFLVSKSGIGYLIVYGSQVFNLNLVMTGIVVLGIISGILYYLILYIEKKLVN